MLHSSRGMLVPSRGELLISRGEFPISRGEFPISRGELAISRALLVPSRAMLHSSRGILLPSRGIFASVRALLAPLVPFLVKFVPFLLAPDFLLAFPREILLYFLIMKNTLNSGISRRRFLAATGVAAAFPTIIPASALGRGGQPAPSERITIGSVGWGSMGPGNTDSFMSNKDCQVVAICDLDKNRLQGALDHINAHYGNKDCKPYHDYRE